MQILRCKIPKRQDTRQYYSAKLRHDTIQKHDTRQNLTINDEAVALADAVEFPRLWASREATRLPKLHENLRHGNAQCAHYNMPDKIVIKLRLPDSETGDFTTCDVHLTVTSCWCSPWLSLYWLAQLLSCCVLPTYARSAGHSTSAGRWSSREHAGLVIPARGPYRALLARGSAAPLIGGTASCPCRMSWHAKFERPQDLFGPPRKRGFEAPSRSFRRPCGHPRLAISLLVPSYVWKIMR